MKKTTRLFSTVILVAMVLAACLALVACDSDNVNNYFVTYDENTITVSGKKGEAVDFPDVTRDGYLFDGWYTSQDYSGSAVESAVFGEETTYYAKWAEVCTITLQPEGGTIKGTSLTVKQGANLLEALADYTPTKGSLQFGGWFDGNTQITSSSVATKGSLTLTARYKASYTVNAYFEKLDGSGYELIENYTQGYAFVGEGFFPELETEGFSVEDDDDIIISEDSSKNVFNVHFKRNVYAINVYESYPHGSVKLLETKHVKYGQSDYLPTEEFEYEGYLMLGWTTTPGASYSDIIGSDYVLNSDISLYPLWEAGYSDMFSGDDYIFLMHDAENTAKILRGGILIEGKYNKLYELYEFKNDENKTIVRAKIDGEHFIYYDTRNASYTLLDPSTGLDSKVTLTFDETNGLSYYDNNGDGSHLVGTYEIDEDGIYVATLHPSNDPNGKITTFAFIVGTYKNTPAFRIRGTEYKYGTLARRAMYYPVMTFDGFGTVTLATSDQSSSFTYTTDKNDVITIAYGQQELTLKVLDYSGTYGYDFYDANLDKTYTFAMGSAVSLTLDGCATAVFRGEDETFTGTYYYSDSVLYDVINGSAAYRTIVTVVSDTNETRVYILYMDFIRNAQGEAVGMYPISMFKEVGTDYTERQLVDSEGYLTDSYLVVEGDGKASTYEYIDGVLTKTGEGTIDLEPDNYSYTYISSDYASTVRFKNQSTTLAFSDYNSMSLCFVLSSSDENGSTTDYYKRYRTKGGSESAELVTASVFGVYTDANGDVFCGILSDRTTYYILTDASTSYYLSFDETDSTRFYVLQSAPLVMYKRVGGKTDRTATLTITWKDIGDDKYEAVYTTTDSSTETTTNVSGYYTSQYLQYPGFEGYLYTFTANDSSLTFKFYLSSSSTTYYFNYYEVADVIEFGSYAQLNDDDSTDSGSTLVLTDELVDGKLVLVYSAGEDKIKGTFDTYTTTVDGVTTTVVGRKAIAFGDETYAVMVYTFTSLDGEITFDFTLNNGYFRICAENRTFTSANGDKLELDGATHIARYTDASGNTSYSYYIWTTGVLEDNGRAVYMLVNEQETYLDVLNDTFNIRGEESGSYNIFKNGVPYGKTITFDGQGKAVIKNNGSEETTSATYTINGEELTVFDSNYDVLYLGKLTTVTIGSSSYPAYSLLMDNIAGSYINKEDLSVIVLDNAGNAVRYNSYGVSDQGYYFRIDDNLFYFINSSSSFAGLYTFNKATQEIVNTGTSMTFYSSDFASIVFYSTGSILINNSESMYYVIENGKVKTYKAANDVNEANANAYGYVVDEIVISEDGKIQYSLDGEARTYTRSNNTHVTFTDANGNTLEFQPDGEPTFTVSGVLTIPGQDGKEDTTVSYYVGLDYNDEGKPYVYLADQISDYVNGGAQKFNFTRNYEIQINYDEKTFSFTQDSFTTGMYAYNFMYLYYLSYYGTSYASRLSSINGLLSIVCETIGDQKTYTVSGVFNYIENDDGTSFTFTNGTLSEAGYYNSNYGHAYVAEFVVNEETYHLTFFLMPPNTIDGVYAYRIYTLTKVTGETVIDDAGTVVYSEELVYTEFNVSDGGKDSEGNDTYYKVNQPFIPTLKYKGKLICSYPSEKTDDNSWTYYAVTFLNGKLENEIRYLLTLTYDDEGVINGGSVEKQILLQATTVDGDVVYAWYDGNNNVIEVVGIMFNGKEEISTPTTCQKEATGESFTLTIEGVTYTVEFTFTEDASGEQQVTVTLTRQTQGSEQAA